MELAHRRLSSDDARNVEAQFLDSFLQINKYHITQDLKAIPSTIYNYLTSIPNLTRVSHSWLWQFMLVHFGLGPGLFFWKLNKINHTIYQKLVNYYLPVSKMKISLTIRFLPSPSLPPKMIKYYPNYVELWQFLVLGG